MLRRRLISLAFVLPLLAGLCIAAYRIGPSPSREATEDSTIATAVVGSTTPVPATQENNSPVFELFGMYQNAVGRGRAAVSPAEYLNTLEARYRQRGYRSIEDFDPNRKVTRKRASRGDAREYVKFFQRDEGSGIANISATGEDADLDSNEVALEPFMFSTLVVPAAGGGSDWATYRIGIDRNKLALLDQLDKEEFPGTDPPDIPRPKGLKRIYSLSSGSASLAIYKSTEKTDLSLIALYVDEMERHGWHLDSDTTSTANSIASGVMCFNRGARSCLIWVRAGKEPNTSTVTISAH